MPTTITIPKGATLSGLAQQYGTTISDLMKLNPQITNPNLIYAGSNLAIPGKTEAPAETTPTPTIESTPTENYDLSKIQSELNTASKEKKNAYDEMIGLQSRLYEDEYSKAGLGDVKNQIATIDTDIQKRKETRDQMLLDEKGKPIPQWMITGRKKLEIESATNDLNRMIDERNSLANRYNEGINEVTRKVGYGINDAVTKYSYWEGEENRLTGLATSYQSLLASQLEKAQEEQRWEQEFALKLANYDLNYYKATTGGGGAQKGLQQVKDSDGNVIGYFDPNTGETTYYQSAQATTGTVYSEKDFRDKVTANIKAGLSLEDLRSDVATLGGVVIKPPSNKTAEQIIQEEWEKSHPTTLWGQIKYYLPGGY